MTKRFASLLLSCFCAVIAFGQSLNATMQPAKVATEVKSVQKDNTQKGRITLPQASVYSVAPQDLFSWTAANGRFTSKVNKVPPRRIGATECFPNDPYIYTVWYCIETNKISVFNAKTGDLVKEAETDVANAARGASYDYNRNKIYVINFSGLFEIDPDGKEYKEAKDTLLF